jgi:hypothetical protein
MRICFTLLMMTLAIQGYADTLSTEEKKVIAKTNYVKDNGLLTSLLSPGDVGTLPIGIVKEINGRAYIVAVDSARITPQGGFFSAYMAVQIPGTERKLAFKAENVGFSPNGVKFSNSTRLRLVSPVTIKISNHVDLYLPADGTVNYIEWDCNGFKSIKLGGTFIFDNTIFQPDKPVTSLNDVRASFTVEATDLHNVVASLTSFTPFKVKGLGDVGFSVTNATVDMSDFANPASFNHPPEYTQTFGSDINLWRGFYLQNLTVRLPKDLKSKNGPVTLTANNIIIDDMGVTGSFGGTNLLSLNNGSAEGWAFSIDEAHVDLLFSHVNGAGLKGDLQIPFLGTGSMGYEASIQQRNGDLDYLFAVSTNTAATYNMPLGAKLTLAAGSSVKLEKTNGVITAGALLNGSVTVEKDELQVAGISFNNLELTSRSPYILRGSFALSGNSQGRSSKFPISVSNVGLDFAAGQATLKATVKLNFMNSSDRGFSGETTIKLKAGVEETSSEPQPGYVVKDQRWVFQGISVERIAIQANMGGFQLNGMIDIFKDHPKFGNGFRGNIAFKVKPMREWFRVNAYFGSKNDGSGDYRYWQLNVCVPIKIPIVPQVLTITSITGGVGYHMNKVQQTPNFYAMSTLVNNSTQDTSPEALDRWPADFDYEPDQNAGLGIMFGATAELVKDNILYADVRLEILFTPSWGLRRVQLTGGAYFFKGKDNAVAGTYLTEGQASTAPIYAHMNLLYDNDNGVFHASIKTYLKFASIKGTGPNNLVGEVVFHVDNNDWYLYIGRPSQMLGLSFVGILDINAYLMIGSKLENMPPPPQILLNILGNPNLYQGINPYTMAVGGGFGFGARFQAGLPKIGPKHPDGLYWLGPFYAGVQVGAGFDVMLTKLTAPPCAGMSSWGMHGWYAMGQVYAYLQARVGIKAFGKRFDIIYVAAGALLQGGFPSPTYMKGYVAGRYRILGGLIKGSVRFTFTVGDDCTPTGATGEAEDQEVPIIQSFNPAENSDSVSVFVKPRVSFNAQLDREINMSDEIPDLIRIKLDKLQILKGTDTVVATRVFGEENDVVTLYPTMLQPLTEYKIKAKIAWEIKDSSNIWKPYLVNGVQKTEEKIVTFKTGAPPRKILVDDIKSAYPIPTQLNFHQGQLGGNGFIQLKGPMDDVFNTENGTYNFKVKFYDGSAVPLETTATYDAANYKVTFTVPQLTNGNTVRMKIFKSLINDPTGDNSFVIFSTGFRVSLFNTIEDKLATIDNNTEDLVNIASGNVSVIGKRTNSFEQFDKFELFGFGDSGVAKPMLFTEAIHTGDWFYNNTKPLLYDDYPTNMNVRGFNAGITWRDIRLLSPFYVTMNPAPLRGMKIHNNQMPEGGSLTAEQINSLSPVFNNGSITTGYYVSWYAAKDFYELRNKYAMLFLDEVWNNSIPMIPPYALKILTAPGYVDLKYGIYPARITYMIPDAGLQPVIKDINLRYVQ